VRDDVDRGHRKPRAVAADPDVAVELHVGHALLAREGLDRVGRSGVAHLRDVRVAEERVVVDGELRVERLHLAVRRHDQRVDLAEHRVELDERAIQPLDDRCDLLLLAGVLDAPAVHEPPGDPGLVALRRVEVQADERLRALLGDLLDLDAALRREHEERLLRAAVERDREVVLLRDVRGLLDPELADDVPADVEAEDLAGLLLGVGGALGELHAARLAAAAGEHLGLDDDGPAERRGGGAGFLGRHDEPAVGDGNADPSEELLALVLVQIHGGGLYPRAQAPDRLSRSPGRWVVP
jgi:hypothetical protein